MGKLIANRPILVDGRLFKTGEVLPECGLRDEWLKDGDASARETAGQSKGGANGKAKAVRKV